MNEMERLEFYRVGVEKTGKKIIVPFEGSCLSWNIGEGLIDFCEDQTFDRPESFEIYQTSLTDWGNMNVYLKLFDAVSFGGEMQTQKYFEHLLSTRGKYQWLLRTCFDIEYDTRIRNLSAAKRYALYTQTDDFFKLPRIPTYTDFNVNVGDLFQTKGLNNIADSSGTLADEAIRFIESENLAIQTVFCVSNIEMMCALEFQLLLEMDSKIKKCRNCQRYFILKGNYQTEYCDRNIGDKYTCQARAAIEKYSDKVSETPALSLYNKYYKRLHARIKYNLITRDDFQQWKYSAVQKRDECLAGEITPEEFEKWLSKTA
jgi:hypothetical protein